MIPSPELRITSIINSLKNVIVPAVDENNPLALEQCHLIIAHLSMLSDQIPFVSKYHAACLEDVVRLANSVVPAVGGTETTESAKLLCAASADAEMATNTYEAYHLVGHALEQHIRAAQSDANAVYRERLEKEVLAFAYRQTERERSWFKQSGLDHNPGELRSIGDVLQEIR